MPNANPKLRPTCFPPHKLTIKPIFTLQLAYLRGKSLSLASRTRLTKQMINTFTVHTLRVKIQMNRATQNVNTIRPHTHTHTHVFAGGVAAGVTLSLPSGSSKTDLKNKKKSACSNIMSQQWVITAVLRERRRAHAQTNARGLTVHRQAHANPTALPPSRILRLRRGGTNRSRLSGLMPSPLPSVVSARPSLF